MRPFEILFDKSEPGEREDAAYGSYGWLGFPPAPEDRPWVFTNFVQSLDGIVSLRGRQASGFHIAQSEEDRWLMDLLRAHADALLVGVNTLREECASGSYGPRGPVYRIVHPDLAELRQRLGRGRETCIFVTGRGDLDLAAYRAFDGDHVDAVVLTTHEGAKRVQGREARPHVRVLAVEGGRWVDLLAALRLLRRDLHVRYLLSEGGPTLNGHLTRAGLVDERFLTVSPVEVGQVVPVKQERAPGEPDGVPLLRPTSLAGPGFTKDDALHWRWLSCRKAGDHQFVRYRRK
ncbi:MAG TPA: dihydrofolate reductase family protein [Terriglobales bacterium]|nr:dihydrofolate reductase family protein [Terriglobales bacterium]